jgi:hypothetical protein
VLTFISDIALVGRLPASVRNAIKGAKQSEVLDGVRLLGERQNRKNV